MVWNFDWNSNSSSVTNMEKVKHVLNLGMKFWFEFKFELSDEYGKGEIRFKSWYEILIWFQIRIQWRIWKRWNTFYILVWNFDLNSRWNTFYILVWNFDLNSNSNSVTNMEKVKYVLYIGMKFWFEFKFELNDEYGKVEIRSM